MVSQHQIHHFLQKHLSHEQPQQPKRSKEVIVPTNLFLISSHACTMALKCASLNVFRFLGTGAFSRLLSRSRDFIGSVAGAIAIGVILNCIDSSSSSSSAGCSTSSETPSTCVFLSASTCTSSSLL